MINWNDIFFSKGATMAAPERLSLVLYCFLFIATSVSFAFDRGTVEAPPDVLPESPAAKVASSLAFRTKVIFSTI